MSCGSPSQISNLFTFIRKTLLARISCAVQEAFAHRCQRRTLAALDDRLLADIGLSRAEAVREARRPFWR